MPPKRAGEPKEVPECILKIGKYNNVVAWNLEMRSVVGTIYGATANFLTDNMRYVPPYPTEEDYIPVNPGLAEGVAQPVIPAALITKLREDCFTGRRKEMAQQRKDEQKIWSIMWTRMSPASQSKVQEEPEYEAALLARDCVLLWEFIRRTHLTHIYGDGDPMLALNIQEQEQRYNALKQGDREYVSNFKIRFDAQVHACRGAGVAEITEPKRALDFIYKLDPKRFTKMIAFMRNNALLMEGDAFPQTLAAACRIASGWVNEDTGGPQVPGIETHSAFATEESNLVAKSKDTEKGKRSTTKGESATKKKPSTEVECFVCGLTGHYARDCPTKKGAARALIAATNAANNNDSSDDDDGEETAYITTGETVLFSRDDVLLDSQASVNVFCNEKLLRNVRKSEKRVVLNGVQAKANGVIIDLEGDFGEVGRVYFSKDSTANILSYAVMVDQGNDVSYDKRNDRFLLKPVGSKKVYSFSRKQVSGSEGRFYCCHVSSMTDNQSSPYPATEHALIETTTNNMQKYTKREVDGANRARKLLSKMGFPSVSQAIDIVSRGRNFDVTARDFMVADAIYGKDIASIKGKTTKTTTKVADITIGSAVVQQEQILSVDIMYVEGVASLIGLATPLELTMAVSLLSFDTLQSSRSAAVVKKGLDGFISTLASRNFVTRLIMSDGEGAIGAIKDDLNLLGIEVDVSGAGGHVARIERKIRTVKERVRAFMSHELPFSLTSLGIAMLVLFCVSRINYQTPDSRHGAESPRVAFTGRQIDATLDYRIGFGDYAQCTVADPDSSMAARTEDCIAMLPTGNRTASVKMMSLKSGKLVSRDKFIILPMPSSVIERLNDMAVAEGRKIVVRSNMAYSTQSGLRKADDPTYMRSSGATVDPAITANEDIAQEIPTIPQYSPPHQ